MYRVVMISRVVLLCRRIHNSINNGEILSTSLIRFVQHYEPRPHALHVWVGFKC